MNSNERAYKKAVHEGFRAFVAIAVSLLMIPYGQQGLFAQGPPPAGNYVPLGAEQLDQLVAPIALYPDALVAQVLTAATYPQQVTDANNWMGQYGNMPPDQRAAAADSMPWDPSVKALTAFPSVLSNMARNYNWTAALGNAYYNQPGDVMNSVQAMRVRAQQAGTLRSTEQCRVVYNGGLVVIEPVNPAYVYVPYYNPWTIYGGPISPWGGYYYAPPPRGVVFAAGLGLGFAAGISIGLFSHYGWGYHNWSPNWHGGVVVYNHTTYISHSTTVINRGNFGGYNRGVFERPGPGVPQNFHAPVTSQSAAFRTSGRPGEFRGSTYANGRPQTAPVPQNNQGRQFGQPRPQAQPGQFGQARPQGQPGQFGQARPQAQPGQFGQARPQQGQPGQFGQARTRRVSRANSVKLDRRVSPASLGRLGQRHNLARRLMRLALRQHGPNLEPCVRSTARHRITLGAPLRELRRRVRKPRLRISSKAEEAVTLSRTLKLSMAVTIAKTIGSSLIAKKPWRSCDRPGLFRLNVSLRIRR